MDLRDKETVWKDNEVFDVPEAVGITASRDFLVVIRDKLISQVNHLTIVSQFIPDIQKQVSILEGYVKTSIENKQKKYETDLIIKRNELDHLIARKEVLMVSINVLQTVMESILWDLKE